MDPIRASHLLSELFTRLDIDGPKFALIAGFPRPTVSRMLDGSTKWNSRTAVARAAHALGMGDHEGRDFLRFLSGDLPMAEAVRRASQRIADGVSLLEEQANLAARVAAAVKKFEKQTGAETHAGLKEFAAECLRETVGTSPTDAQVRQAVASLQQQMTEVRQKHVLLPKAPSSSARLGGSDRPRRR